jgi:hypothetical protein
MQTMHPRIPGAAIPVNDWLVPGLASHGSHYLHPGCIIAHSFLLTPSQFTLFIICLESTFSMIEKVKEGDSEITMKVGFEQQSHLLEPERRRRKRASPGPPPPPAWPFREEGG